MDRELAEDRGGGRLDEVRLAKHRFLLEHRRELAAALNVGNWHEVSASLQRFAVRLASLAGTDHRPTRIQ
jgi:hypothetical protein